VRVARTSSACRTDLSFVVPHRSPLQGPREPQNTHFPGRVVHTLTERESPRISRTVRFLRCWTDVERISVLFGTQIALAEDHSRARRIIFRQTKTRRDLPTLPGKDSGTPMHLAPSPPTAFYIAAAVQAIGLFSVVAVRYTRDFAFGPTMRWLFFSSLAAVGIVTQVMVLSGNILWLPCGITLSLMAVGATLDMSEGTARAIW
jgi:hypothetical protein